MPTGVDGMVNEKTRSIATWKHYRLGTLLVGFTLLAILVGPLFRQMGGNLGKESSQGDLLYAESPEILVSIRCPSPQQAEIVEHEFDCPQCVESAAIRHLQRERFPLHGSCMVAANSDRVVVKLVYDQMGRNRLSLPQGEYVFDADDRVAQRVNESFERAFVEVAREMLEGHPLTTGVARREN